MPLPFIHHPSVIIDCRSPIEFEHAHIPSAISIPLFSDQERAIVGTLYKKKGQLAAVKMGLKLVTPKLGLYIEKVQDVARGNTLLIYCARGGMRSQSMSWHLENAGFSCQTIEGGYKTFRRWVLKIIERPQKLIVLGGFTGVGKTEMLHALRSIGEQVIDLEALARHRGSAYGAMPGVIQPTNEQFENLIAWELGQIDPSRPIWIEDESRLVGLAKIPDPLYHAIRNSPIIEIQTPIEERLARLHQHYGNVDREILIASTQKITKRLGREKARLATRLIKEMSLKDAACLILTYYDGAYLRSRKGSRRIFYSPIKKTFDAEEAAAFRRKFQELVC